MDHSGPLLKTELDGQLEILAAGRLQELDALIGRTRNMPIVERQAVELSVSNYWQSLHSLTIQFARRRNQLCAPVLRLPPEILQKIMLLAAPPPSPSDPRENGIPCLFLGHICSHLRSVLLSTHQLWAEAVCVPRDLDVTNELLKRAAGAPLLVYLADEPITDDSSEFLLQHLGRARRISMSSSSALAALWVRASGLYLPYLESLDLSYNININPSVGIDINLILSMQASCTILNAPKLRRIRFCDIYVPFDPSQLYELDLVARCSGTFPSAELILSILRTCVRLQNLYIEDWFPDPTALPAPGPDPIYLPSLHSLNICGFTIGVHWLWSHISVPHNASVKVVLRLHGPSAAFVQPPDLSSRLMDIHAFANHVIAPNADPISGCSISPYLEEDQFVFQLFANAPGATTAEPHQWPQFSPFSRDHRLLLEVRIEECDITPEGLYHPVEQLCDVFGLANAQTVELCTDHFFDHVTDTPFDRIRYLSPFRAVRTLCFSNFPIGAYSALSEPVPSPLPGPYLYPNLESLSLLDLVPETEDELDDIILTIERRTTASLPLKELKIAFNHSEMLGADDTPASRSFRARLEALVPSVEYDTDM